MADHTQAIADLEAAINAGLLTATIDGTAITYRSLTEMKSILRQMYDEHEGAGPKRSKRPVAAIINTGGF